MHPIGDEAIEEVATEEASTIEVLDDQQPEQSQGRDLSISNLL
jgi:hypothetical protein